jgi:hypothetical protein
MFKRLMMAALLLAMSSTAISHPNPGGDNPGSTNVTIPYFFGAAFDGSDSCMETADWCGELMENPLVPVVEGLKGKRARIFASSATAMASVACSAAAEAAGYFGMFFAGGGELSLTRHGHHGAMHHIELDVGLASGTLTVAAAGAQAAAMAEASAVVAADVSSMDELCADIDITDEVAGELCVAWEASASAGAEAVASASSFASSGALAASGSFGAVAAHNEVYAANIEEYHAAVATAAGSFSFSNAEAYAEATASAYAEAFAEAFIEACASVETAEIYEDICNDGFDDTAEEYAQAYAAAYAQAQATAFAGVYVEAYLPVTYINENGIYDTISFGPEAEAYAAGAVEVSCQVHDEPAP